MIPAFIFLSLAKTHLSFDVRCSEIANLTYQLDSITGQIPHEANGRYKELWKKEFLKDSEDEKFVEQWRTGRSAPELPKQKEDGTKWPLGNPYHDGDPEIRMRAVGFDAESVLDYGKRLSKFAPEPQVKSLTKILDHFQPRFHAWWQLVAEKEGKAFAQNMQTLLDSPKVRTAMDQFVEFYRPSLGPKFTLSFVLMYKPSEGPKESTAGQQLERHSLVQFLSGEKPEDRIDVVLHEACHFLFNHGPKDQFLAFQKGLVATKRLSVVPCFNLLDEGLATVFGNGIIAQAVQTPERFERRRAVKFSWYYNAGIDLTAKTMFPWIKDYLASGKTLYDAEFRTRYLESMEKAFGPELTAPAKYMISLSMTIPPDFDKSLFGAARDEFRPAGMYSSQDEFSGSDFMDLYQDYPAIGNVVVIKKGRIDWLAELGVLNKTNALALREALKTSPSAMVGSWNGRLAPTFVIVADNPSNVGPWLKLIVGMNEMKEGLQTLGGQASVHLFSQATDKISMLVEKPPMV